MGMYEYAWVCMSIYLSSFCLRLRIFDGGDEGNSGVFEASKSSNKEVLGTSRKRLNLWLTYAGVSLLLPRMESLLFAAVDNVSMSIYV